MIEHTNEYGFTTKVIEDSLNPEGNRLITVQLRYPRFIHSEVMTHRVFSRNASSSRAIPVHRMLERLEENFAQPVYWGMNQPGMQATTEADNLTLKAAMEVWNEAKNDAIIHAKRLNDLGIHKQIVNRVTEPFQFIDVIVSATDWENYYNLRDHEDAQPEIHELARLMRLCHNESQPKQLKYGQWHLPYILPEEHAKYTPHLLALVSIARCARVSYKNHDKTEPSIEKDLELAQKLIASGHWSPAEHPAMPTNERVANFSGWHQVRHMAMVSQMDTVKIICGMA